MVYFGISISTSGLGIDPYLVFIINGFLEYPAHFTTLVLIDKYGRRRMFCLFMMTSTISCLTAGFIKPGAVLVTIVMVGKYAVTSAFGSIFVHSAEVYPTPVRSAGMGVASMAGRFGSIFSPLVPLLSYWWKPLPVLFFSCLSFLSSLSCLLLPETVGRKLPQTINVYSMPIGEMAQVATEKIT
ncbi:organic cation transporter protein-like [Antedon mediterranea]|uniref:organic cation transporter protein-like n=1 Tax=Antedon mediterranea TaxID=105859 RepID=UPI003AF45F6A